MTTVNTQVSPEIVKFVSEEEGVCELSWEINEKDNNGVTTYRPGGSYTARLYKGASIGTIKAFSINGGLSYAGIGTASKTEQITFEGEKTGSLSFPCYSGFSYRIIGNAYTAAGAQTTPTFRCLKVNSSTVVSSCKCFCVIEVTYTVQFSKYKFSSGSAGETLLIAVSTCIGNSVKASITATFEDISSSCCCSSSSISSVSAVQTTSVTLLYKDFVTGAVLEGVSVSVDGVRKGTTNAKGEITIYDIRTNRTHTLKASKEGYLTTDSDSLANDSFVINT